MEHLYLCFDKFYEEFYKMGAHLSWFFFPKILLFLRCQCQLLNMPFPFLSTKYLQVILKNTVLLVPKVYAAWVE